MIKKYADNAAYVAAGMPTEESRVALIEDTNDVKIDGVNVLMDKPTDVCAVFYDLDGKDRYVRWDTIQKDLIPDSWTHVGYSFGFTGRKVKILDKAFPSTAFKWLNCWQLSISAISATTIKFYLHMKGDYATWVPIEVTLDAAEISTASAAAIDAALDAAGNTGNVGYANHGYWAYLADANGNIVETGGTQIIVQCDFCADYRQYQFSDGSHALVGCTMTHVTWGDMPASSDLWRKNGCKTYWGFQNVAKGESYYATNGKTPTANWSLTAADPVTKAAFETSAFCADLRAFYGTYHNYIVMNKVMWPHPEYGVFDLIDADEMTRRYGSATFTKKGGETDVKFPALHTATTVGYGVGKYAVGKWHLSDITDGMEYMADETLAKLQEAQTRMDTTVITNSVTRWFARRYGAYAAWLFNGTIGSLSYIYVNGANRCQAVTLSDFD